MRVKLLADVTPLRESPAFRRMWAGGVLSAVGGALTNFAVTLQVYELTKSPAAVGLLGLAVLVPTLAVGLFGGAAADALDRRKVVLAATAAQALVSATLAAQAYAGLGWVWLLYVLVAAASAVEAVNVPARRTVLAALLPPGQLAAGQALNRLTFQVMMTVGPAVAGVIVAAPHLGFGGCYLIDSASFAAAAYGAARLPSVGSKSSSPERTRLSAVTAGVSFIRRTPVLAGTFLADLNATFFGLPTSLFRRSTPSGSAVTRARSACSPRPSESAAWSAPRSPGRSATSCARAGPCSSRSPSGVRPSPASRWPPACG